ncbi:MAG: Peptidase [Myxococcaceae bacterium]|nr:Peptidase [Myxococcaceae bacterium]
MTIAPQTPPPTRCYGTAFEPMAFEESALPRAWEPSAYGYYYEESARPKPYRMSGAVAVVEVLGPLDSRAGWWCDSYDAILARFQAAHADPAVQAVVLSFDSPGGACAGNLDTADALRAAADASGKPTVAHAGTMACSAAYALACAADQIHVTRDGLVGSIGVIATVYDRTKANEDAGLNVKVVRSGTLKADPHPDVALTDASVARVRARVNDLAQAFGAHVSARRPQAGDPLALQGATVTGAAAVTAGLADAVGTLADAITTAAALAADSATTRKNTMDLTKAKSLLDAARASAGAATDDELPATIAALKTSAGQVPELIRQRDEARAALATREQADRASAREAVLTKHRARGAITPAMEADEAFMADLAPLGADALDRVLGRMHGVTTPEGKANPAAPPTQPAAAGTTGARGAITADERKIARQMDMTDEQYVAARDGKEQAR